MFQEYVVYAISFFSGLGLIIFAMQKLSVGTQSFLNPLIRYFLNALSASYYVSFFFGSLIAFSIQSGTSAATMSLSYANSGLVRIKQLRALLLGSNLGTVLTLFLFTIDFGNLDMYLVAVGFFPMIYSHWPHLKSLGKIIFSVGLLLLGHRFMMNHAVIDGFHLISGWGILTESGLLSVWLAIAIIVLVSVFFRSTIALLVGTMSLLAAGNLTYLMATAFVLAVNLGKAMPVLRLSIRANQEAKKGALFHAGVHLISVFILSLFIPEIQNFMMEQLKHWTFSGQVSPLTFVAFSHLFYNLFTVFLGTLLFVPLGSVIDHYLGEAPKKENQKLVFIGNTSHISPALAIEQVFQEVKKLAATIETILQQTKADLIDDDEEASKRVLKYERITDNIQIEIYEFLDKVMEVSLTSEQGKKVRTLSKLSDELEHIADACKSIALCKKEILQLGGKIDGDFLSELAKDFDYLLSTYEFVFSELTEQEDIDVDHYHKQVTKFEQKYIDLRKDYLVWLQENTKSSYEAGIAIQIGDILFNLRKIHSHTSAIRALFKKFNG